MAEIEGYAADATSLVALHHMARQSLKNIVLFIDGWFSGELIGGRIRKTGAGWSE